MAIATEKLSFDCIYPHIQQPDTHILHIILPNTVIKMFQSKLQIMFINVTIQIKWVKKRSFFFQNNVNDIYFTALCGKHRTEFCIYIDILIRFKAKTITCVYFSDYYYPEF